FLRAPGVVHRHPERRDAAARRHVAQVGIFGQATDQEDAIQLGHAGSPLPRADGRRSGDLTGSVHDRRAAFSSAAALVDRCVGDFMQTRTQDRRQSDRVTFWSPVVPQAPDGAEPAALRNLSVAGLSCTTSRPFPEMTQLKLTLDLPATKEGESPLRL